MGSCRCAARAGDRRTVPLAQGGLAWRLRALRRGTIVANAIWLACIANHTVIPAKAGTYAAWVPAFAGMTILCGVRHIMPLRPSWRLDGELATGLPIGVCGGTGSPCGGRQSKRETQMHANVRKSTRMGRGAPHRHCSPGSAGRGASPVQAAARPTCRHLRCIRVTASWRYRGSQRRRREGGPERVPRCMMLRRARRDGAAAVAAGARGAICLHCR